MNTMRISLIALCAMSLACGCDSKVEPPAPVPTVAYSTLAPERKAEFAQAVADAVKDFDDLYGKVTVAVEDSPAGPVVTVAGNGKTRSEQLERSLGVVLANLEFKAPGIRFTAMGDARWKMLFSDSMQVQAAGKFNFLLP